MKSKKLLWAIPIGLVLILAAAILALPGLVASNAHRGTIETLASSLTGRQVRIGGRLSLALFPEPRLIAERITIGGPDNETITARSLTLDIAMNALLRGRLSAQNLTLQSPVIAFPWPLPGGAAAIAPPPWLTTLHAQINDGQISLGAATFQHVSADIFTGADGAVSISGTGSLAGQSLDLSLSLAGLDAAGAAPLSIDAKAGPATLHLSGNFNAASAFAGTATLETTTLPGMPADFAAPISGTANVNAASTAISLTHLQAMQNGALLTGTAQLSLATPALRLDFSGQNLRLPALDALSALPLPGVPVELMLDASNSTLAGAAVPQLHLRAAWSATGIKISALNAILPGSSALSFAGAADPAGGLSGQAALTSSNFPGLLAAFGSPAAAPDAWRQTSFTTALGGTLDRIVFSHLSGTLGTGYVTGGGVFTSGATPAFAGALHFNQLELSPLTAAFAAPPAANLGADLEITADKASLGGLKLSNLLIDAALHGQLQVRRLTASAYGGILAASFTVAPDGAISVARATLSLPSATPIAAILPARYLPPAAVLNVPLAAAVLAAGPPGQLATSLTMTLGDFSLAASPVLDLPNASAAGPLTLRHPSAIAAFKTFGVAAGLPWPGAGSLSLRADMVVSPQRNGLPDFVLSLGDLTATGAFLLSAPDQATGQIDADTLALPSFPTDLTPLWTLLSGKTGKISLAANRVLLAGAPFLGATRATLALQPDSDDFTLERAGLAGGVLSATLDATTAPATPPSLIGKFHLERVDASQLSLPLAFPLTLPTGTVTVDASLTAAGYGPQAWAATLAGQAALAAKSGGITGFDLAALTAALARPNRAAALKAALLAGTTPFDSLSLFGIFDHGIYALTAATLQTPAGTGAATGNIDLPDQDLSLNLTLRPALPTPPNLELSLDGSWAAPKKIPGVRAGLEWIAP